ncbi:MAG: hypothetical protein COA94_07695 [Rickettsiales bacterium]|nr:MAG: hypothetical protein COA94_07695 [Rickettsiales bacterium]
MNYKEKMMLSRDYRSEFNSLMLDIMQFTLNLISMENFNLNKSRNAMPSMMVTLNPVILLKILVENAHGPR